MTVTAPLTELQVVVYRVPERLLQLLNARTLEGDYVSKVDHLAVEEPRLIIELGVSRVSSVLQHEVAPLSQSDWLGKVSVDVSTVQAPDELYLVALDRDPKAVVPDTNTI